VQVFRPHNIYGPDMGWKHVIPQFMLRAAEALNGGPGPAPFAIQGDGQETRAFCYVDDVVDGIVTMYEKGGNREVYHIGNDEEISIRELVDRLGHALGGMLTIAPSAGAEGGTPRRCPDISKMRALGYDPKVGMLEGLRRTAEWYMINRDRVASNELM
jgi:UDP-glucose 4-epimerase